jgi:hypothetical protein
MSYACPLCEFTDKDYDTVLSHIWDVHEDEVSSDIRPIDIGEVDAEAGECYAF